MSNQDCRAKIEETLRRIINDIMSKANISEKEIHSEDDLLNTGMDSVSFMQIVVRIESEYDIDLDDDFLGIDSIRSIKAFVEFIERKLSS